MRNHSRFHNVDFNDDEDITNRYCNVVAATIGAGIGGAVISSSAASKNAKTQANAAEDAASQQAASTAASLAQEKDIYNQNVARTTPFVTSGTDALTKLNDPTFQNATSRNFTMADFTADPGYQYRVTQGIKQLENGQSAVGSVLSGRSAKALSDYAANQATSTYDDARNYFTNQQATQYQQTANLANTGLSAANALNGVGTSYANTVANLNSSNANAQAASTIAQGNASAAGTTGVSNAWTNGINNTLKTLSSAQTPTVNNYGSGTGSLLTTPSATYDSSGYSIASPSTGYNLGNYNFGG